MSSVPERETRLPAYGLRLGVWYATLLVLGSLAIMFLTYLLTSASLAQRDRQIIDSRLGAYAAAYNGGGLRALEDVVQAEQQTAPERVFVRVIDRFGREGIVLSQRGGWDSANLETGSITLSDGTVIQVGRSTEAREDILSRFRAALGLVTLSVFLIGLTGGALATQSALKPIRQLIDAVQRIITTGRTDARVPLGDTHDAIDELTKLFNAMVDCVEEADRVLVMLTTLMDISEAESGAIELHREMVPLVQIVERAVDLYRDTADAKGVALDAHADRDVVASVDRLRFEQVAANLLDNAIKYTPPGGH